VESEDVCALERLLARKRQAGRELLDMDAYERWGAQHDTDEGRAQRAADAARSQTEYSVAVAELTALVERLRREQSATIDRWVELHRQLLQQIIDAPGADSTAVFVAKEEEEGWQAVQRGEKPFVDENVFYIHVDRERYAALFGIAP
jgi:hypothetical protein